LIFVNQVRHLALAIYQAFVSREGILWLKCATQQALKNVKMSGSTTTIVKNIQNFYCKSVTYKGSF